jgi:hypothetical protein
MLEFVDYRRVHLEPSILVDRSRGEKLVIEMDVSFPRVPCYRKLLAHLAWIGKLMLSVIAGRDGYLWGASVGIGT